MSTRKLALLLNLPFNTNTITPLVLFHRISRFPHFSALAQIYAAQHNDLSHTEPCPLQQENSTALVSCAFKISAT
jgi:hypothetical protein